MPAKTQPARGMRDFLPADVRRREYVIRIIKDVYERYGFEPLETPAVENIETLLGKYGEEGNQLIFKILKRGEHERTGEADLALRYDLTVPLARVVAEYGDKLPRFFKRYQIQPVWRADRPARGRFREFYQCDVDCIGTRSLVIEAELFAAISDVLLELGLHDFFILLNHRDILRAMLEVCGIEKERHMDAFVALDKLDKIGKEGIVRELQERNAFSEESIEHFGQFIDLIISTVGQPVDTSDGSSEESLNQAMFEKLSMFLGDNESGKLGVSQLKEILSLTESSQARGRISVYPNLARGLSYYTGAIFEIGLNRGDFRGSIGGGGRYDNLVGMFSGRDIPACGFSLGLERIIVVMTERGMFPADLERAAADVLVTVWSEESIKDSLAFAGELRKSAPALRVDVYPEADKLGKQFKYASTRGVPFVVVIGDDERARGEVALKDMRTGEQQTVKREQAAAALQQDYANHS